MGVPTVERNECECVGGGGGTGLVREAGRVSRQGGRKRANIRRVVRHMVSGDCVGWPGGCARGSMRERQGTRGEGDYVDNRGSWHMEVTWDGAKQRHVISGSDREGGRLRKEGRIVGRQIIDVSN